MAAKPIFIGGTASHAGKSWMATAICRFLVRRGFKVAPFKSQNMSNNSYPCAGGGEIGRAQVAQAEACGLEPHPDMNPILLKPSSDMRSQVVLNGKVWRTLAAAEYYEQFDFLLGQALDAYARLAARYDYVVVEGAGSVCELNLRSRDLVNLGLAERIGAPVLLVGDIDRGGVFASIVGSVSLVEPRERALIRSFAVNRFRGDPALFAGGVRILEEKTGLPCLGVFPHEAAIRLDDEDSVGLDERAGAQPQLGPRIAAVHFPRISNTTDFRLLPGVRWMTTPDDDAADFIFLPGSKSTLADLAWMRATGLAEWVLERHRQGATVIGICGGYQMLGEWVEDPECMESRASSAPGLGLLPVRTVMQNDKTVRTVEARTPAGVPFSAYEIHIGATAGTGALRPFAVLADGSLEGARAARCLGTYLHGAFEDPGVVAEVLGFQPETAPAKDAVYERLAGWFSRNAVPGLFDALYL